eukprot:scaffold410813_cov19-Prasinocladus_malaysianus.AAC.1
MYALSLHFHARAGPFHSSGLGCYGPPHYQVSRAEAIHLLQQMGLGEEGRKVTRTEFLASQIDWQ